VVLGDPLVEPVEEQPHGVGPLQFQVALLLEARARIIREIFGALPAQVQQRAARLTVARRPSVDATALMAPVPEGATPREIDNGTRHEIIFQLLDGGRVDTASFVEASGG